MQDHLSTQEVAWMLGRSAGTVRDRIKDGDLERLVDELVATNEAALAGRR